MHGKSGIVYAMANVNLPGLEMFFSHIVGLTINDSAIN